MTTASASPLADVSDHRASIYGPAFRITTFGVVLLVTLQAFEAMAVGAALPTAARALHGLGAYGWAFTGYLVANVVGMVVSGQINDRRGPVQPMLAGLALFILGLMVSGTAVSMGQLVAGRVLQGLGGGLTITAIYVVIGGMYPEALRPKIFALSAAAWVVPALLGPLVAGTLAEQVSWRWAFLGLLPFGVIGAGLMLPVIRAMPTQAGGPISSKVADPRRILRALAAAGGVATLAAAGQRLSVASAVAALAGIGALTWGLRALLPAGTFRVRPGVAAPVALRGLLAGAFFGLEALVPLTMTVQHGYGPIEASLPLTVSGVTWAIGSWWQGHRPRPDRVGLIRNGFWFVAVAGIAVAVVAQPGVPGWLIYLGWAFSGLGAGLTMSSVGVLLLNNTTDADRGADSAALQVSDVVSSSITTGFGGVLVALAVRGALGYTGAFTTLDLVMALIALVGVVAAGRARAAS